MPAKKPSPAIELGACAFAALIAICSTVVVPTTMWNRVFTGKWGRGVQAGCGFDTVRASPIPHFLHVRCVGVTLANFIGLEQNCCLGYDAGCTLAPWSVPGQQYAGDFDNEDAAARPASAGAKEMAASCMNMETHSLAAAWSSRV